VGCGRVVRLKTQRGGASVALLLHHPHRRARGGSLVVGGGLIGVGSLLLLKRSPRQRE
jgi:hypothetical protein